MRVFVVPLSLHRPIGQDLEVMSAIHAVQPHQPSVVPHHAALIFGYKDMLIRHPALRERSSVTNRGVLAGKPGGLSRTLLACVPLQSSGVYMLANEHRDDTGNWMRVHDSLSHKTHLK